MISNMEMEKRAGIMAKLNIPVNSSRERNMAEAGLFGKMAAIMMETLSMVNLKAMANITLQT